MARQRDTPPAVDLDAAPPAELAERLVVEDWCDPRRDRPELLRRLADTLPASTGRRARRDRAEVAHLAAIMARGRWAAARQAWIDEQVAAGHERLDLTPLVPSRRPTFADAERFADEVLGP